MNEKTCENMSLDDLRYFEDLIFESERGNGVKKHIEELSFRGYGDSLENISKNFRSHLSGCFKCNEYFEDKLNSDRTLNNPENLHRILKSLGFIRTQEDTKLLRKYHKMRRSFQIEHVDMDNESEDLGMYIFLKVSEHRSFKMNQRYEEHIRNCHFCKEYTPLFQSMVKSIGV